MRSYLLYISLIILMFGCSKEYEPINITDLNYEFERDDFSDTLYLIRNFNVTSTNDSILEHARAIIKDENDNVIIDDHWKNLVNSTFGLPDRRVYDLSIDVYRDVNGNIQHEFQTTQEIDNNDYPDFIKINSFEMDPSCIDDDGDYTISNSHYTVVDISNDLDYYFDEEEYTVDDQVTYLEKNFNPKTLTFTFSNLYLPTRSFDDSKWRFYYCLIRYPRLYFGTIYDSRDIAFRLSIEAELLKGNNQVGIEYSLSSDDDYSNGGGLYFGSLKYEWIYE